MKREKRFAMFLAVLMLFLAGCGAGGANSGASQEAVTAPGAGANALPENEAYWDAGFGGAEPGMPLEESGSVYQNSGAKLIRRAELNIQTEQFDQSVEALNQMTASCGGYFEMASVYGGGRRDANASRWGEYIVRVPAEKYDQFLNGSGELGYAASKTESSDNVGEQYYDIEARLKTQRTKQERLLALLERAETMEDIIALESALSDVELQIEMYSSDLNRYDALIDFATFTIYLNEVGQVTQDVGETASLGARMAAGFQASFRGLVQGGRDFLIWASYNIFLLVILAAVAAGAVVLGRRELRRLKQKGAKHEQDG